MNVKKEPAIKEGTKNGQNVRTQDKAEGKKRDGEWREKTSK